MQDLAIGTKIRFLTDLYDSDDKEIIASAGSLGIVSGHHEDFITATTEEFTENFVVFSDEYEEVI